MLKRPEIEANDSPHLVLRLRIHMEPFLLFAISQNHMVLTYGEITTVQLYRVGRVAQLV